MHVPTFIERKRDGSELSNEEIAEFIERFTKGEIPDYQASAWAMAVFFQGMSSAEISALTSAMMHSGRVLSYPAGTPPKVDKHSTGGVGDKVSLVLAPLLACDELWVPMISGRGLGITGGTLDKLESISGFQVGLSEHQVLKQLEKIGVVMIGQTEDLCPADRKLYALRDVTATVPSIPLIVASIMSKKLAETLDRLVLDVKWGTGAFMRTHADAEELATALTKVGQEMGVAVSHHLTPMSQPLGHNVGNALEVAEAVDTLQGRGPNDLVKLTLDLATKVSNADRDQLLQWLEDGTAWRKFVQMVELQGGDATALERITTVHSAPLRQPLPAPQAGVIQHLDAGQVGRACVLLGAGRKQASDKVDFAVGCSEIQKVGTHVEEDEPVLMIHARDEQSLEEALLCLSSAVEISPEV
jgi:pyrimidine-nucleoside phosphorylase